MIMFINYYQDFCGYSLDQTMGLAWPGSEPDLHPEFTTSSGTHRPLNCINGDRALSPFQRNISFAQQCETRQFTNYVSRSQSMGIIQRDGCNRVRG